MRNTTLRRLLALTATTGLAAALTACGPDDAQQSETVAPLLSQLAPQAGWSMNDLAGVDPELLAGNAATLPEAVPMHASYRGGYDYAPAYDYGPEPLYDDGYYADDIGADDYQWLALASALGGMLGDAPPDYGFGYDGVQPWAWETGDRYLRYAEPIYGGYRYYYYQPDSYAPFLVSDPYYSYGYQENRLVVIYDRSGRVIDARRAARQRQAAQDYFARARQLYEGGHRQTRFGVSAPLWDSHRDEIARDRRQWSQARVQRAAWRTWDAKNEPALHRDWAGEALVRREAEQSFSGWKKASFKTPPPRLYSAEQREAKLQKVAQIRADQRQERRNDVRARADRRPGQAPQRIEAKHEQQLARVELHRQAQAQRQQARLEKQDKQADALRERQQHAAQAASARQQAAHKQQAERKAAQQAQHVRQAEQHRQAQVQSQAREQRQAQATARAQEQRAQHQRAQHQRAQRQRQAEQRRAAQQQRQAEQVRAAHQRQQAERQQAAHRQQQAERQRASQQRQQAERQRVARPQQQAQQQAEQQRAARQQQARQQQAARQQQRQAQQARAAKPQQAPQSSQLAGNGGHGHGKGRGRD
jgi:hypothetical protein